MDQLYTAILENYGIPIAIQKNILESFVILVVLMFIRMVSIRVVNDRLDDVKKKYLARRWINYMTMIVFLLVAGRIWLEGVQSLTTMVGIAGAGLLIALQDTVLNVAGWIFLAARRPFVVGDRIEISGIMGDVIDIRLFQFSLIEIGNWVDADQSTGRIIHVPNGKVFRDPLYNYTQGFEYIWHEIPVLITFESNWEEAKKILTDVVNDKAEKFSANAEKEIMKAAEKYMILFTKLTPIVYTSVEDCGVLLTIRYLTRPRQRRSTSQDIWEAILREFAKHGDIDFAYPTTRFYNNMREGKPDARAPE